MSVNEKSPHGSTFSERKTAESGAESRMNGCLPEIEIHSSPNLQVSEKLNLSKTQLTVNRKLPSVPSLEPTEGQIVPFIPVNEIRKVRQKPRRVLPCLPPVVQEILQWSINPEEVLRGAASVSHLLNLPTINEENVPSVQYTETKVLPSVPRVKRILPSVPLTPNRTLPSKQPNAVRKPLPKFRAEFKKRMLPSLPTIKERKSPRLSEVELAEESQEYIENRSMQDPGLKSIEEKVSPSEEDLRGIKKRKKKKQRRSKHKARKNHTSLQLAEKEAMDLQNSESSMVQDHPRSPSGRESMVEQPRKEDRVLCAQEKVKRTQKSHQSKAIEISTSHELTTEHKLLRYPMKEREQPSLQRRENGDLPSVYPKVNQTRPTLLSADSYALLELKKNESEEMPRLRARLARRGKTLFQPCVKDCRSQSIKQALPSIPSKQKVMIPRPTSEEVPSAGSTVISMISTENRPLPSIRPTQELLVPKPPSTPKGPPSCRPFVTRARPKIAASVNRSLPSIPPTQVQRIPKPPSTPKGPQSARPIVIRARTKENRPLPSIQSVGEQTLSGLSSSSQQNLVKFPFPSVHCDEKNYHSAVGTVERARESNVQPLIKETNRSPQGNLYRELKRQ